MAICRAVEAKCAIAGWLILELYLFLESSAVSFRLVMYCQR